MAPILKATVAAAPNAPTSPDPRKLREKVIFALIGTNSTGGQIGRAQHLIQDAEQIISYVISGEVPKPTGAEGGAA